MQTSNARLVAFFLFSVMITAFSCSREPAETNQSTQEESITMKAEENPVSGQLILSEGDQAILQYNYRTIESGDDLLERVTVSNLKYARPRSNYIHPLYGLDGEQLTLDWPVDHPHHRGIYWAWPEVKRGEEMGDLHALQKVFARPTGVYKLISRPGYAEIEAENRWLWEDRDPVVSELAVIRAYPQEADGRIIDLEFHFTAPVDGISLARRGTELYGGLNVRLSAVENQEILFHTDPESSDPRTAWAQLSGTFLEGGEAESGVSIFQHRNNPEYPGDWVKYPELNWFQPTFPTAGTRYELNRDKTLVLRYRFWIHRGRADAGAHESKWRDFDKAPPLRPVQ